MEYRRELVMMPEEAAKSAAEGRFSATKRLTDEFFFFFSLTRVGKTGGEQISVHSSEIKNLRLRVGV